MSAGNFRPAAVRTIDIKEIDQGIYDLAGYSRALVIFRQDRAVIGREWYTVRDGAIGGATLREYLPKLSWPVWQRTVVADPPPPAEQLPSATIVVCTHERPDDLQHCLTALQAFADQGHDVLVVDNAPRSPRTAEVAAQFPAIRYVVEPRQGLDHARNCGLRHARGEIVAFTDDDAQADPAWIDALRECFLDPTVALATGITMPVELETPAQMWFEESNAFGRGYLRRMFDLHTLEPLASGRVGAGVNMAVRRSTLAHIGHFDEALDGGTASQSGGDQEFFYRVIARGYRAVYTPEALVWHRHRREWEALQRCLYGYGVGLYAWWFRELLVEGDLTVLKIGPSWFIDYHVKNLLKALLRRPGAPALDLAWAEFRGAVEGPRAYLRARAEWRKRNPSKPVEAR